MGEFRAVRRRLQFLYGEWNRGGELDVEELDNLKHWQKRWCEERAREFKFKTQKEVFDKDEKCSAFFFQSVRTVTVRTVISGFRGQDGITYTDVEGMLGTASAFYEQLFGEQEVDRQWGEYFLWLLGARVPEGVKEALEMPFSKQELLEAIKGMANRKVPGKDGISKEFYLEFWEFLGDDFMKVINEVFVSGELGPSMKEGVVSLLFKKGDPELLSNWRPLTLLGVDYKIIARALAVRLGKATAE